MKLNLKLIDVNRNNLKEYPQIVCFTNAKHPDHHIKMDWIREQYEKGLKIKLLFLEEVKGPVGFIEYIPGENCWRAVDAKGFMFIHCLWTNGRKYQHQGLGSALIKEVEKDSTVMNGVAVLTSDKAFMANQEIFLKNGYKIVVTDGKEQLMVKQFKSSKLPEILDHKIKLQEIQDLTIIYSDQCPWVSRFIREIEPLLKERNLLINIIKLNSANEAQQAPSLYSVFNLIYKGKLLADRYISVTRFKNILNKEIKL
jgi:hypothetical protein